MADTPRYLPSGRNDEFAPPIVPQRAVPRGAPRANSVHLFGLADIERQLSLELRDSEGTYQQEIAACWAEFLRNLPREPFTVNMARNLDFILCAGQNEIEGLGIQKIYNIRVEWGNIWVFLQRAPVNSTDYFVSRGVPLGQPIWYEQFGDNLRIWPAPGRKMRMVITASNAGWDFEKCECLMLDNKYFTFAKYYCMALLAQNYLRDMDFAQIQLSAVENERQKLHHVRSEQTGTGRVRLGW